MPTQPVVGRASRQDCDQIFDLINLAFSLEIGNDGIAFRTGNKFRLRDTARKNLDDMIVLRINKKVIGCVKVCSHNGLTEIGYLAVHPDYQGHGHGSKLMHVAEKHAKGSRITVGIPSCRTDVIPFFTKRGYRATIDKSLEEIEKLYPEDFSTKILTRTDFVWQIFLKMKNETHDVEDE